jgi:NTP pyrophosphatase (non-canonical NTP hydrolase)
MMTIRQFLLTKLAEECAEVAQRAMKQQQFGKDEKQPGQDLTNAERLRSELNDLLAIVFFLEKRSELPYITSEEIVKNMITKYEKVAKYLRLSQDLGQVEEGEIYGK